MRVITSHGPARRQVLLLAGASLFAPAARSQGAEMLADDLRRTVLAWTGGITPREDRVRIDIAPLVENGNAVPVSLSMPSAMTAADHVRAIALFNERNPQREVAVFHFSPRSGRAEVSTRIRLATSQNLVAVARLGDGSCWSRHVEIIVTLAACIE